MELSRLGPADIPEVMRIERTPGYAATVGRFEADEHARQMATCAMSACGTPQGWRAS